MPKSIPPGLTADHVHRALADLDAGFAHPFGEPTKYELVHTGKRYAPKAVVGLACRYLLGTVLPPDQFSGGEAPGRFRQPGGAHARRQNPSLPHAIRTLTSGGA
jgi:hypothetical protein